MDSLLTPHLLHLVERAPSGTFVLGGGLGLNLKREHLIQGRALTLVLDLPEARVTTDIDLFLSLDVFVQRAHGQALRKVLDELQYTERTPKWQFEKPLGPAAPSQMLVLDLLARRPEAGERVKVSSSRVGKGADVGLHGREVAEAFAVETSPLPITVRMGAHTASVRVPHPYAWINMKIRAAHDWLRYRNEPWELRPNQSPPSEKHCFDVTLLVAMLTESEGAEGSRLARDFFDHPVAAEIRGRGDTPLRL